MRIVGNVTERSYRISVVMAVYNVEAYVAEAIESVIAQDIGFEENVQLILVDDGSPDGSGEICDGYAEEYPDNILVLHKENGGVSSARNLGLRYIRGEYVNFMDSDDKLSACTFTNAMTYADIYGDRTDVISIPFEFFERLTGRNIPHNLKFSRGSRIIDLREEYNLFQFSLGAAFVRREAAESMHFDESLVLSEDAKELYKIFLRKPTLGLADGATYYYRKRAASGSAVDSSMRRKSCYADHMRRHYLFMINNYLEHWGYVPKFVQYAIMYDIQWKFATPEIPDGVLTEEEREDYFAARREVLGYIDDDIVFLMNNLPLYLKYFVLSEKYGELPDFIRESGDLLLENPCSAERPYRVSGTDNVVWSLNYSDGIVKLEGSILLFNISEDEPVRIYGRVNGELTEAQTVSVRRLTSLGKFAANRYYYRVVMPLDGEHRETVTQVMIVMRGTPVIIRLVRYGFTSPVSNTLYKNFYYSDHTVFRVVGPAIRSFPCGKKGFFEREMSLRREIKLRDPIGTHRALLLRFMVRMARLIKCRPIWIVSDRLDRAGDNGEAFFRYMRRHHPWVRVFFLTGKEGKKHSPVRGPRLLTVGTFRTAYYNLLADRFLSSQADIFPRCAAHCDNEYVRDLYTPDRFVFLQHGVTCNNIASWLSADTAGVAMLVTASPEERAAIISENCGYDETNTKLTGFPRFDRLRAKKPRYVTLMPTWRLGLSSGYDRESGNWNYDLEKFAKSDFCRFYSALTKDVRILSALRKKGLKLAFVPHPNITRALDAFDFDKKNVKVLSGVPYRKIYARSALVLTDYSSAVFDFAYLRRPVIYAQFDKDSFYEGQVYTEGYFDVRTMGFGEVETDYEGTVARLLAYIERDFEMSDEYRARADSFFAYRDRKNSERVYRAVAAGTMPRPVPDGRDEEEKNKNA